MVCSNKCSSFDVSAFQLLAQICDAIGHAGFNLIIEDAAELLDDGGNVVVPIEYGFDQYLQPLRAPHVCVSREFRPLDELAVFSEPVKRTPALAPAPVLSRCAFLLRVGGVEARPMHL